MLRGTGGPIPLDRTWVGQGGKIRPTFRSYLQAVGWPRPAFTPTRTVNVTTQAQLTTALSNLQDGDRIVNTAVGGFAVTGEFVINIAPATMVEIDLGIGSNAVRFDYGGTSNLPSVWMHPAADNLRIYGGRITNTSGGAGIDWYGNTDNILWWDFYIHDCWNSGLRMLTNGGNLSNHSIRGEITNCGLNAINGTGSLDPHAEKGTGLHGAIFADTGDSGATMTNVLIALNVHDQPTGAAIEIGQPSTANTISGITIYLKADKLTFPATSQVAGNGIQPWGSSTTFSMAIPFLQVTNSQGRAFERSGRQSGSCAAMTVSHGRSHNNCQNTSGMTSAGLLNITNPYDPNYTGPPTYNDCTSV